MNDPGQPSVLAEILSVKREEVARKKSDTSLADIRAQARDASPVRRFRGSLEEHIGAGESAIIAEIKKASPSRGVIRADIDVAQVAQRYETGGAAALSVLTDRQFFSGDDSYVSLARGATRLPVLRKEFILDPWQVYETRVLGADCLLLIVSALEFSRLHELHDLALACGLDVLVEVHHEQEIEAAIAVNATMVGINNRNLHGFETHLDVTRGLAPKVLGKSLVVAESGIKSSRDIRALREVGVSAFLVGEALMEAEEPLGTLREMVTS